MLSAPGPPTRGRHSSFSAKKIASCSRQHSRTAILSSRYIKPRRPRRADLARPFQTFGVRCGVKNQAAPKKPGQNKYRLSARLASCREVGERAHFRPRQGGGVREGCGGWRHPTSNRGGEEKGNGVYRSPGGDGVHVLPSPDHGDVSTSWPAFLCVVPRLHP